MSSIPASLSKKENKKVHRYESDLTSKEKRQMEIEKIKSLPFSKKVEHMWAYHKLILASPIILIALIVFAHGWIQNLRTETVLSIAITNGFETDVEGLTQLTRERLNIENRFSEVMIDPNYVVIDGEFDMHSVQKFTVIVAAGGMDILISNPEIYEHYKEHGLFVNMSEIFKEELATLNLVDAYAIDITHYPIVGEGLNLFCDTIYLMVIGNIDLDEENHDGMTKRELVRGFYKYVIAGVH